MNDVKWIKLKVGMFDGASFKKIKRAKIEGVADFRDKLTAVWFELLDLGAKVNNSGLFINDEIAYRSYEDIAIMLDRTDKEVELCMNWFIKENMITIINDVYSINNWLKYQNEDGLEKIREQNRVRQANFRKRQKQILIGEEDSNVIPNVSVTLRNANALKDNNTSISNSKSISNTKRFIKPNIQDIKDYIKEKNYNVDAEQFYNYYESVGWVVGKNKMKNWKSAVGTWERRNKKDEPKKKEYEFNLS